MYKLIRTLVLCAPLLAACEPDPPAMPEGVNFQVIPALISDSLRVHGAGPLKFRGGVGLQSRDEYFGSFSGLHLSQDRTELVAIGWGGWLTGILEYDPSGNLAGFTLTGEFPILDQSGNAVTANEDQDAESLFHTRGYYYVGFETNNRIWRYGGIASRAAPVDLPLEATADVPGWGGFSSVVETRTGKMLALTEGGRDEDGNRKGWIWDTDGGGLIWLRASRWLPVDLAQLPNGDLLLVEVRRGPNRSWHNRLSRIDQGQIRVGNVMQASLLAVLGPPDYHERIEGLHATTGDNGETLVYTISDSSNNWPTHILMFELVGP